MAKERWTGSPGVEAPEDKVRSWQKSRQSGPPEVKAPQDEATTSETRSLALIKIHGRGEVNQVSPKSKRQWLRWLSWQKSRRSGSTDQKSRRPRQTKRRHAKNEIINTVALGQTNVEKVTCRSKGLETFWFLDFLMECKGEKVKQEAVDV
jgi:hypothetical protein